MNASETAVHKNKITDPYLSRSPNSPCCLKQPCQVRYTNQKSRKTDNERWIIMINNTHGTAISMVKWKFKRTHIGISNWQVSCTQKRSKIVIDNENEGTEVHPNSADKASENKSTKEEKVQMFSWLPQSKTGWLLAFKETNQNTSCVFWFDCHNKN